MLIQFSFKNFNSFRDEAILDLSAAKMTEFSGRVIYDGGERILPVAAIYGANASGKSNVYNAFVCMRNYVINSLDYGDEKAKFEKARPRPFLFDASSENEDTSFEVYFTLPNDSTEKTYNYGFCIGQDGITEEWFNYKARTAREYKTIFYRDTETLDLTGIPKASRKNIEIALEKEVLIVSLGAKLKISKCKLVRDWFLNCMAADFGNISTNYYVSDLLPEGFVDDIEVQKKVVKYFKSFDESIKGFEITKLPPREGSKDDWYTIDTLHQKIGSDKMAKIPLSNESAGTLKMFALYPKLDYVLNNEGVIFIDELNARLHPLLVRNLILTFLNPGTNPNHAQLIFTTHDTWQLTNQLLRRDEIWFTDKDDDGISTLYSLADFVDETGNRIRKDESYEKNYLVGKYGAVPFLRTINFSEEK